MDALDLNSINKITYLSVPQLVRQFKSVFHITPHRYLVQVRIKQAAELLKVTKKPVHEIAWMCDFENVSAFCRAFKFEKGAIQSVLENYFKIEQLGTFSFIAAA